MAFKRRIWKTPMLALTAVAILLTPILAGCGSSNNQSGANLPPVDDSRYGMPNGPATSTATAKHGLSTGQKVAILAGAAALYYMYKKNKAAHAAGNTTEPQYYLSKNGRVYYRDQTGQAHWVTPPPGGIQVPLDQAQEYQQYQGYNNRTDGRDLMGLGNG